MANRYFLDIYPIFLFLPAMKIKRREPSRLGLGRPLPRRRSCVAPWPAPRSPALHAKRFPYTLLPVEMTN